MLDTRVRYLVTARTRADAWVRRVARARQGQHVLDTRVRYLARATRADSRVRPADAADTARADAAGRVRG